MSDDEKMSDDYLRGIRDFALIAYEVDQDNGGGPPSDFFQDVAGKIDTKRAEDLTEWLFKRFGAKRPDWTYEVSE